MPDKLEYSRQFRLKVLALMLDNIWLSRFGAIVQPGYFEQEDEEVVAQAIYEYREAYHKAPSDPIDLIHMVGDKYGDLVYDIYDILYEKDLSLVQDTIVQFAKEQAAKVAVLEGIEDIKHGNLASLVERVKVASKVGDNILSSGIDPYRDVDKWLYDYWTDKIPTGMIHVDQVLEGGLAPGELGVILAPLNRGKSMALVNIGYGAASIGGGGKNVVHFVHEMSAEQTAKRYAARTLFRFPTKTEDLDTYAESLYEKARKLVPGKVRVIYVASPTPSDIRSHMDALIEEGFNPELIIDDYPDLMRSEAKYTERRYELSANFTAMREIAYDYDVPCWAATQGNRDSLSKEIITVQQIAEDIGKAQISDVIISLCQTYDEEKVGQCRLFMAKVRDGEGHQLIGAKFFGKAQAIVTTGFVQMKETRGEQKDV